MNIRNTLIVFSAAILSFIADAQVKTTTTTTLVKNVTTTVVESVSIAEQSTALKRIAVFVQNRTRVIGMDDEIDGIRDRLSSAFAEVDGFSVVDSAQAVDTFRRNKVTAGEEKSAADGG